jgi:anti-sigma B factor antagonist
MSVVITEREREGIRILDVRGRLVAGEGVSALRDAVNSLLARGFKNVILNLAEVDYIDSTGLGTLVICHTTLQKNGGVLKILNLNDRHLELLVLTKLTTVFELFDDELEAVNSFFPERQVRKFDILSFVQQLEQSKKQ